ncbi:MAG TPA: flagellar basal body-associated FliL family protein [Acidimicrobiales bacterium]|nr:flagellar basal body-associated FliL family protein [Acidimicrobiales bacterium]
MAATVTAPPPGKPARAPGQARGPAAPGEAPAEGAKGKGAKAAKGAKGDKGGKKKGKKKLFIVLLLVVVGVAGAGYMTMMKKPPADKGGPTTTAGGPLTEEASLTVNLRDNHYLEFTAALQTYRGQSDKVLTTDQAIVLDILNAQAEAMTEGQLLQPNGPARLKADIIRALNQEFPGLVQAVYFEQFVMQ